MRAAADVTGGHGFYNNNELADLLQRAAADSSSYYMLGYYLEKGVNPGWRKLKVKGDRAGRKATRVAGSTQREVRTFHIRTGSASLGVGTARDTPVALMESDPRGILYDEQLWMGR